ncbi:MAG: hypothetical protein HQK83_17175 [Fibrobacteria bacterium]|nr:hypothetical protein [Fibrobacteria bacterium]
MNTSFLSKIKTNIVKRTQTSTFKIEELARTSKLHINIISERRKLARAYESLGKEAFLASQEGTLPTLDAKNEVPALLKEIQISSIKIKELESVLSEKDLAPV